MHARTFLLSLALLAGAVFGGDASLEAARHAQALLGPEIWSRVIRVENEALNSRYPRELDALVFELEGVLWFYSGIDGTQSFSVQRGRLAEDKADFGPLLREIEPGFRRWRVLADAPAPPPAAPARLPNGCFVECVAALRARLARGERAEHAQLLAYYVDTGAGPRGHTVLVLEEAGRLEVVDPDPRFMPRFFSPRALNDPLAVARELGGDRATKARLVPLHPPAGWRAVDAVVAVADEPPLSLRRIATIR